MSYTEKILNDQIRKLDENQTLLDMLLELEGVLDRLDLYAYKNWISGELVNGPDISRHFLAIDLMYPHDQMPDPEGAKRLLKRGIPVKFSKDTLTYPVKPETTKGIVDHVNQKSRGAYGRQTVKAIKNESKTDDVWIVTIQMPRKYLDTNTSDFVEIADDDFFDSDIQNDVAVQQAQASKDPTQGIDPVNVDDTEAGEL